MDCLPAVLSGEEKAFTEIKGNHTEATNKHGELPSCRRRSENRGFNAEFWLPIRATARHHHPGSDCRPGVCQPPQAIRAQYLSVYRLKQQEKSGDHQAAVDQLEKDISLETMIDNSTKEYGRQHHGQGNQIVVGYRRNP